MIYDVAVIGAGCAGWQLLYQLSLRKDWANLKIILLEENEIPKIYPTWCFWTKKNHPLEFLSSKIWDEISIATPNQIVNKSIFPYRYIYIEGESFYDYFNHKFLPNNPNITFRKPVKASFVEKNQNKIFQISTNEGIINAKKVYSSKDFNVSNDSDYIHLSQNFKGWRVKFDKKVLDPKKALFMDFRHSSLNLFEFMYILPFSAEEGLVEWTTFIGKHQKEPNYELKIKEYLQNFFPEETYEILRHEEGEIPMTNFPFSLDEPNGITHIGTVAGMIKPSSGYTFNRITRDSVILAASFNNSSPYSSRIKNRFKYYDTLLLRILRDEPEKALPIFYALFENNTFTIILRFLDEETSIWEDIGIFSKLPILHLLKAIFKS